MFRHSRMGYGHRPPRPGRQSKRRSLEWFLRAGRRVFERILKPRQSTVLAMSHGHDDAAAAVRGRGPAYGFARQAAASRDAPSPADALGHESPAILVAAGNAALRSCDSTNAILNNGQIAFAIVLTAFTMKFGGPRDPNGRHTPSARKVLSDLSAQGVADVSSRSAPRSFNATQRGLPHRTFQRSAKLDRQTPTPTVSCEKKRPRGARSPPEFAACAAGSQGLASKTPLGRGSIDGIRGEINTRSAMINDT